MTSARLSRLVTINSQGATRRPSLTVGGAVAAFDQRLADAARQLDIVAVD